MPPDRAPDDLLDEFATPILRLDAAGVVVGANAAATGWLGVGLRRLLGVRAEALEREGGALAAALAQPAPAALRLRRVALAFPGSEALRFADLWLVPREGGHWLEAHPVDEFPGEDPALLLPAALSASLRGLAH
ncbi:MAG TPA: PAS domain-containing sensor histidine kinase, partial [Thermomonas sp.]|nr:PAS domain-containing sensor histidine kinase [Thermomonas sp.]